MGKKVLGVILSVVVLLGFIAPMESFGAVSAAKQYKDVKQSDWFYASVRAVSDKGIISGNPDGTFKPDSAVTYGEFITMAVKAAMTAEVAREPAPVLTAGTQPQKHWAQDYYNLALTKGYFSSNDIGEGMLDMPISRCYMALVSSRILGEGIEVKGDFFDLLEKNVKDIVGGSTPYEYEIIRSYGAGILSGYPDGTFRPNAALTRAESASVIWRLVDESKRKVPKTGKLEQAVKDQTSEQPPDGTPGAIGTKPADQVPILTQEERIQAIIRGEGPKISFNPQTDTTLNEDDRVVMQEKQAREYMDLLLPTLKFHGSKGKYYMTVTFPKVPEGYKVHLGVDIVYKPHLQKPIWSANTAKPIVEGAKKRFIANTGTVTKEIIGMKSLSQLSVVNVGFWISKIDDTYTGSTGTSYFMQRAYDEKIEDHFTIRRQVWEEVPPASDAYNMNRHFTWK